MFAKGARKEWLTWAKSQYLTLASVFGKYFPADAHGFTRMRIKESTNCECMGVRPRNLRQQLTTRRRHRPQHLFFYRNCLYIST